MVRSGFVEFKVLHIGIGPTPEYFGIVRVELEGVRVVGQCLFQFPLFRHTKARFRYGRAFPGVSRMASV